MVNVIKVYLQHANSEKTEIRRLAVSSDVINKYDLLCVKIIELFPVLCGKKFDVSWKDADGDLILMSSCAELAQAVANAEDGLIKIYIKMHDKPSTEDNQKPVEGSLHPGVFCDGCESQIEGHRYKCLQCKDFDLCGTCNAANKHPDHDMLKLVAPVFIPRQWINDLSARRMWRSIFGFCHPPPFGCRRENEENKTSSPKPESSSAGNNKWQETFSGGFQSKFHPAETIFQHGIGEFLKDIGVEVSFKECPFGGAFSAFGGPFTHNKPQNQDVPKPKEDPPASTSEKSTADTEEQLDHIQANESKTTSTADATPEVNNTKDVENQGAKPKVNESEVEMEISEEKQGEREMSPIGNKSDLMSSIAEGWTLLNKDDAGKKSPTEIEAILEADKVVDHAKVEEKNEIPSEDPKIVNALLKMRAMGFTNEGGWLERLLITKGGNINEALDALYPNTQRR